MKQQRLQAGQKKTVLRESTNYDRVNMATAREVLRNPAAHGGDQAITVVWARLVVERIEGKQGTNR